MIATRRGVMLGAAAGLAACALPETAPANAVTPAEGLVLNGQWRQGGFAMGRTQPHLPVFVDVARVEVFPTDQATGGGSMVKYQQ